MTMDRRQLLLSLAVASAFGLASPDVAQADELFATALAPEFDFGTADFTIETWVKKGEWSHLYAQRVDGRILAARDGAEVGLASWRDQIAQAEFVVDTRITKGVARYTHA